MGKYSRLGNNTVLVFIGNIGSKLISLLMLPFYTKWLSINDYGKADLIVIYVSFLLGIITLSICDAIFIFPKEKLKDNQKIYFSSGLFFTLISFTIAALLFSIVKSTYNYFGITNSFTQHTWIIFWMITATFLQSYMQQFARSIDRIKVYAISGIVLTASTATLSFILIPKYGLMGFLFAQISSLSIAAIYSLFYSKAYTFFSIHAIKKKSYGEMLRFSIPLIPNGIMWWLVAALNRPIMEHYLGLHAIGIFAVANRFPSIINMLFSVFGYSWQISVIEEFNKPDYKDFYNKILRIIFTLLTLFSCVMAIFSKSIVSLMADEKFFEAWNLVPILTIAVLFSSLSGFVGTNFSATKESRYFFYSSVWGALASIFFNIILIPEIGLMGAAISVVLSYIVMSISRIKYSWKYVPITQFHQYIFMILINILIILIIYFINNIIMSSIFILILLFIFILINKSLVIDLKLEYEILKNRRK